MPAVIAADAGDPVEIRAFQLLESGRPDEAAALLEEAVASARMRAVPRAAAPRSIEILPPLPSGGGLRSGGLSRRDAPTRTALTPAPTAVAADDRPLHAAYPHRSMTALVAAIVLASLAGFAVALWPSQRAPEPTADASAASTAIEVDAPEAAAPPSKPLVPPQPAQPATVGSADASGPVGAKDQPAAADNQTPTAAGTATAAVTAGPAAVELAGDALIDRLKTAKAAPADTAGSGEADSLGLPSTGSPVLGARPDTDIIAVPAVPRPRPVDLPTTSTPLERNRAAAQRYAAEQRSGAPRIPPTTVPTIGDGFAGDNPQRRIRVPDAADHGSFEDDEPFILFGGGRFP